MISFGRYHHTGANFVGAMWAIALLSKIVGQQLNRLFATAPL